MRKIRKKETRESKAVRRLLNDPLFLYRAGMAIGDLGVVGEERNRLIIFLAGITRLLADPVSVLVKGSSSAGKSNLVKNSLRLFPPNCVIERASLSAKAPAHSEESLANIILFIQEYRGGKDAQLLIRLLQSEGRIAHEYTSVLGRRRSTEIAEQVGTPVVITTTTDQKVYPDDETRFLSCYVDTSVAQNLAIVKAQVYRGTRQINPSLKIWRKALALIGTKASDFHQPPQWMSYVAEHLPLEQVRVRRDWKRFLSLCSACALVRPREDSQPINITFPDYCVAYRILEPAFAATAHGVHRNEAAVVRAVEQLKSESRKGVTVRQVGRLLGWADPVVYMWVRRAINHCRLEYEEKTHERNQKFLVLTAHASTRFLPRPSCVFRDNDEIGSTASYVDPLTGVTKRFSRK